MFQRLSEEVKPPNDVIFRVHQPQVHSPGKTHEIRISHNSFQFVEVVFTFRSCPTVHLPSPLQLQQDVVRQCGSAATRHPVVLSAGDRYI